MKNVQIKVEAFVGAGLKQIFSVQYQMNYVGGTFGGNHQNSIGNIIDISIHWAICLMVVGTTILLILIRIPSSPESRVGQSHLHWFDARTGSFRVALLQPEPSRIFFHLETVY
jgi:hypothetical protein